MACEDDNTSPEFDQPFGELLVLYPKVPFLVILVGFYGGLA